MIILHKGIVYYEVNNKLIEETCYKKGFACDFCKKKEECKAFKIASDFCKSFVKLID